ncbi:hypothetical protein [Permianibacter aggregans]|uniref:Gliding motility-associated protein GldC n=1 Tax=Permianibacter aggregans TaxID=1510150 RepID=A0A4R6UEI4_9GAMM|nr:hypothetical protein [Permianibacter aggregans]QGX41127.1 hypothetical protein E2H98_16215 [Permianibacter aggregans]TDQ44562.1 gliding motility-associated protein GldC [Permianibacter aggregans]
MSERLAEIGIAIKLNAAHLPTSIQWSASDAGFAGWRDCNTINVTLWDSEQQQLSAISLWTLETPLLDMYAFLSESLAQLADTCQRATHDAELTRIIADCAHQASVHVQRTLQAQSTESQSIGSQPTESNSTKQKQNEPEGELSS